MFNFDAETWLVIYPHGAGGRFLSMLMSLDPAMAGLDGSHHPPTRYLEYREAILYGLHAHWLDHELSYNRSRLEGIDLVTSIVNRKKYIFSGHMDMIWLDQEFYSRCNNLKIIDISITHEKSKLALDNRRIKRTHGGPINSHELTLSHMTPTLCQTLWDVEPYTIELLDFWDKDIFITWFTNFIKDNNLNIETDHWHNLYLLWQEKLPQYRG